MAMKTLLITCLLATSATARRVADKQLLSHHAKLLESPTFEPLSEIALHLSQIYDAFPDAERSMGVDFDDSQFLNTLKIKMNRMRPVLENIFRISTTEEADEVEKAKQSLDLDSNFARIKEILEELHNQLKTFYVKEGNSEHLENITGNIQSAMFHAAALDLNATSNKKGFPLVEKFIIREYIPAAEKIYKLHKEIEQANEKKDKHYESPVSKFGSLWQSAHTGIVRSATNMLRMIAKIRNSIANSTNQKEEARLSAVSRFVQEGFTWKQLIGRLQNAEKELLVISHNKADTRMKDSFHNITLAKAISLVNQIEAMIPNLKKVHDELHATENTIKYMASRSERSKEQLDDQVAQNNKIRQMINGLRVELNNSLRSIRKEMGYLLGLKGSTHDSLNIDLASIESRFVELRKYYQAKNSEKRFEKEMEELRKLLKEMKVEMKRLQNYEEAVRE